MKEAIRTTVKKLIGVLLKRNAIFLPRLTQDESNFLSVIYNYRVIDETASVKINEDTAGRLSLVLKSLQTPESSVLLSVDDIEYNYNEKITVDFKKNTFLFSSTPLVRQFTRPLKSRRFDLELSLFNFLGKRKKRVCSFYVPGSGPITEDYFYGSNYFDYERQAEADAASMSDWMHEWLAPCKILEIGCGSGLALLHLQKMQFDCYGVDILQWAVDKAASRIGKEKVALCNVETDPIPFKETFDAVFLSAVFEHFHQPYTVLESLSPIVRKGTLLFIRTANPDSLTHLLFKQNWEGYFDYSHFGIEQVSPAQIRTKLPQLGWEILSLETDSVWVGSNDEAAASLREFYAADARFRKLLKEYERGDFLSIVARRVR